MYRFINDRSNLDEVVSIYPKGSKDYPEGHKTTRREELMKGGLPRADIVLFSGCRSEKQYCLYVTTEGFTGDMWILDVLTDEEYEQVQVIAGKMRQNALEYLPAGKLIVSHIGIRRV
jgi:hypothetical protein